MTAPRPLNKPSLGTKLAYGVGSVAFGVKNNGFDYFLLIFYSQVLGADASLVGTALLIGLLFDAFSDPIIGYLSDNTRSRWGRRHPYMYGAAIPIAFAYYFLWNPPADVRGNDLFLYLLTLVIGIRFLITLYEVPSSALVAEITDDYDERTSMLSFSYFFGWSGGTLMATVALAVFLVPTPDIPNGMFNIEGFGQFGLTAACVIFSAIMISSLGTHSQIPNLREPPPQRKMTLKVVFSELFETLANRSLLSLFAAALFGAIATGVAAGLNYYINSYYWEFSNQQISIISLSVVISAVLGLVISPIVSRKIGKKQGAIRVGMIAFTVAPLSVFLRLFDLMPANGDPTLFPIVLTLTVLDVALIITFQTLMASMIADVVEESELKTKRRSEGVFFAAITFSRKFVQGFGVVSATLILGIAQFPKGKLPGEVDPDTIYTLGMLYAPTLFIVWMIMIGCLKFYKIDRQGHEANLRALREQQAAAERE